MYPLFSSLSSVPTSLFVRVDDLRIERCKEETTRPSETDYDGLASLAAGSLIVESNKVSPKVDCWIGEGVGNFYL
jgi:hypothetical protein